MLVYAYVPLDVLLTSSWVRAHASQGAALYRPLTIVQWLHMPPPSQLFVNVLAVVVVLSALVAMTGWHPRWSGSGAAASYLVWMLTAMSYGKVDHDRFAFLVALAVLPTAGAASLRRALRGDAGQPSQTAGWVLRMIQVAVVATYFLAAFAKIRFGGWNWATGAVLERALLRRHTVLSGWMLDRPHLLVPMQFAMILAELLSPLVLLARSDRARTVVAIGMWSFHLAVFAGVTIIFFPHCVAVASFVPLERAWSSLRRSGRLRLSWSAHDRRRTPTPHEQ